jgi:hypothetical protein
MQCIALRSMNKFFCKSFFMDILTHEDKTTMLTANAEIRLSRDISYFRRMEIPMHFLIFDITIKFSNLKIILCMNRHQGSTTYVNCTLQTLLTRYCIQCRMLLLQPVYPASGATGVLKYFLISDFEKLLSPVTSIWMLPDSLHFKLQNLKLCNFILRQS